MLRTTLEIGAARRSFAPLQTLRRGPRSYAVWTEGMVFVPAQKNNLTVLF